MALGNEDQILFQKSDKSIKSQPPDASGVEMVAKRDKKNIASPKLITKLTIWPGERLLKILATLHNLVIGAS